MNTPVVELCDGDEGQELETFLVERIYEFNAKATGSFDGRLLAGCMRNEAGEVIGAFNGHTWGGCCVLAHLWVHEAQRGRGLGRALLQAAEAEAAHRGCEQVVVSTHSFQAPAFYQRLGYQKRAAIRDQPKGHANLVYVKRLGGQNAPAECYPIAVNYHVRLARPVSNLERTEDMYCRGLGLRVVASFEDHDGFDGVILGLDGVAYHFEFTRSRKHPISPTPTVEDLVVFYIPSKSEWEATCARMRAAGFTQVTSFNPYWEERGRTVEDHDGYRIVLKQAHWTTRTPGDALHPDR